MSRIGKKPIAIPQGVEVNIDGHKVTVKGPKGTLTEEFLNCVNIAKEDNNVVVTLVDDSKSNIHGLTRTLIHNMIIGVSTGFEKALEINGVGSVFFIILKVNVGLSSADDIFTLSLMFSYSNDVSSLFVS